MKRSKFTAVVLLAFSMVMALMAFTPPDASAHTGKFEHDDRVPAGEECPEGAVPSGERVENLRGRFGPYIGCEHPGYSPIMGDVALCEEARGRFIAGLCTFDRALPCGDDPAFTTDIGDGMCLRLAEVLNEFLPAIVPSRSLSVACADSDFVQENAAANRVDDTFSEGNNDYLIVTGSSCGFNCEQGWDMNCDGKLGDFCASELDLRKVADIGTCMAALNPTPVS